MREGQVIDFSTVTEIPGIEVSLEQLQVISFRYKLASRFVDRKDVLEVGCGPGLGLGYLAQKARMVTGVDYTERSVQKAFETYGSHHNVHILQGDAHSLPFKDTSFDTVVTLATVCYLNLSGFLKECHRVLKRGGVLAFCTPNKDVPDFRPSRFSTKYYSVPELFLIASDNRFSLELFGAFAIPRGRSRLMRKLRTRGSRMLGHIGFAPRFQSAMKGYIKRLIGYRSYRLKSTVDEDCMRLVESIQLKPLSQSSPDFEHRVLYGIARAR